MTTEKGARTIARLISEGKISPQFIGRKSYAVLKQEIFSLVNRYNPKTMTQFELTVYTKDVAATVESILKFPKKGQDDLFKKFSQNYEVDQQENHSKNEEIKSTVDKIRHALQNIKN